MNIVSFVAHAFMSGRTLLAAFVVFSVLGLSACSGGDEATTFVPFVDPNDVVPPPSPDNMSVFLRENMDYGTLLRLIEDADLADALQGDNAGVGWTLFAATDGAFGDEEFELMSAEQKIDLVKLHLYSGRLAFSDLMPGMLPMTMGSIAIQQNDDGTLSVGGARVVARDRVVSNGVIHFVNLVLSPAQ
ncbi:MAG: fasciclin domain-containing protein [Granulosicoccus sp.]